MIKTALFISLLVVLSCTANSNVSSINNPGKEDSHSMQETSVNVLFISGTRQKVFPGVDDGNGSYTENWILKLDAPRGYAPIITMEYMGYLIPIDREITYISEKEKSIIMFSIKYPLMNYYDEADNQALAIPLLFLKTSDSVQKLDLSGCTSITPVAYPTRQKEGGY